MTIEESQQEIIDEFNSISDWMDRYSYIIELGNSLEPYPEKFRDDDHIIAGCQSNVWLYATMDSDGIVSFEADSDAIIIKGIMAMFLKTWSGHTPKEILASDFDFIDKTGLKENLTPLRSNGIVSILKKIHSYAVKFDTILTARDQQQ